MAEIIAQRRLKYFYDMPNTKELLNSKEFAEDVLEKLNLPLEEITKLLSNVTEKEAYDVFALLDFMMNTRQAGFVGAS